MAIAAASDSESSPRYRFEAVVLDPAGHRLQVDGRERACSRRALALLHLLCQRPGRVWPRAELLDALWPGGQVVADESLSQLVFRLRAALGAHAERIVTVRGVGVRLDAEVAVLALDADEARTATPEASGAGISDPRLATPAEKRVDRTQPELDGPVPSPSPSAAAVAVSRPSGRRLRLIAAAVALPILAVLWLGVAWLSEGNPGMSADVFIDEGYGLRVSDLRGQRPESARLLTEAFQYDDHNDRERAVALMETVLESDANTPVPALILALWSTGIGDDAAADRWLARGSTRMNGPDPDPYLLLLERYTRAERGGNASEIVRHAGALLDLRPQAWRFRLARAHLYGYMGLRDQALAELKQIQVNRLDHSRQAMALGDRASFGDVEGARRILDTLPSNPEDANEAFVRGRIAWSAGEIAQAREHMHRTVELARRSARLSLRDRALAYAGVLAMLDGDLNPAIAHIERARAGANERGVGNLEIDLTLLLAHLHLERGDVDRVRTELEQAKLKAENLARSTLAFATVLASARMAPDLQPDLEPPSDQAGAVALLGARHALLAGDRGRARSLADQAVAQGVMDAWLAEEARLLLAQLGAPVPDGPPLDPPHPPLTRYAVRMLADRSFAAASNAPANN